METKNRSQLPALNADVLFQIFEYLHFRDRKNVRLVSRLWHEVCCRRKFTQTEAFFISVWYELGTVVKVLDGIQTETLNLKFDSRSLDESSVVLWETCGPKINSLQFRECSFDAEIVPKIFHFCVNLTEFSADKNCYFRHDNFRGEFFFIFLVHNSPVAGNLTTFHLGTPIGEFSLLCIAHCFPNLVNLDICLKANDDDTSEKPTNFYTLLELLRMLPRVRRLRVKLIRFIFFKAHFSLSFARVRRFDLSQLARMSMTLPDVCLRGRNLKDFLSYKFWTRLNLFESDVSISNTHISSAALARLLGENPQLEELSFTLNAKNESDMVVILRALVKSNLKKLNVVASSASFSADEFFRKAERLRNPLIPNNSVHTLKIRCESRMMWMLDDRAFSSILVRYFRNVRNLWAKMVSLNDVFKFQTNLRALKIQECWPWDLTDLTVEPRRSIKTLEFLQIFDPPPLDADFFTCAFPDLKYFIYHEKYERVYDPGDNDAQPNEEDQCVGTELNAIMSHLLQNSPNLVGISVYLLKKIDIKALRLFFESCRRFQRLRYISLTSLTIDEYGTELLQEMVGSLTLSSSFREAWIRCWKGYEFHCFFNIVSKEFEFCDNSSKAPWTIFSGQDLVDLIDNFFQCWSNER